MESRILSTFLIFLAWSLQVYGQPAGTADSAVEFGIAGQVVEFGITQRIGDARITLERYDEKPTSSLTPRSTVATAITDFDGSFAFRLEQEGYFRITSEKDGYVRPGIFSEGTSDSAEITIDEAHPRRELRLFLARPSEISGVVVDEDTEEPVAGLPVAVRQFGYTRGRIRLFPGGSATTDADGRFVLSGLAPDEYVVGLGPLMRPATTLQRSPELRKLGTEERLLAEFTDEDLEAVDEDYDWTYWPGGFDFSAAIPASLGSGVEMDLGKLVVKRVPKYRVLVSFAGDPCTEGDRINLDVKLPANVWVSPGVGSVPCGSKALMRGFSPGSYEIEARMVSEARGTVTMGLTRFTVAHGNSEISVLLHGMDIGGNVTLAEGAAKPDFGNLQFLLQAVRWAIRHPPIQVDSEGSFRLTNVAFRDYRLLVSGIPQTHYLKDIRYNGRSVPGGVFSPDGYAEAHSLELILDDKPAALKGVVMGAFEPVPQPDVVLVRWPPTDPLDLFFSVVRTTGSEDGEFLFEGLAPGDYRLLAVPSEPGSRIEQPNVLEGLLGTAERISLGESEVANVTLDLTAP